MRLAALLVATLALPGCADSADPPLGRATAEQNRAWPGLAGDWDYRCGLELTARGRFDPERLSFNIRGPGLPPSGWRASLNPDGVLCVPELGIGAAYQFTVDSEYWVLPAPRSLIATAHSFVVEPYAVALADGGSGTMKLECWLAPADMPVTVLDPQGEPIRGSAIIALQEEQVPAVLLCGESRWLNWEGKIPLPAPYGNPDRSAFLRVPEFVGSFEDLCLTPWALQQAALDGILRMELRTTQAADMRTAGCPPGWIVPPLENAAEWCIEVDAPDSRLAFLGLSSTDGIELVVSGDRGRIVSKVNSGVVLYFFDQGQPIRIRTQSACTLKAALGWDQELLDHVSQALVPGWSATFTWQPPAVHHAIPFRVLDETGREVPQVSIWAGRSSGTQVDVYEHGLFPVSIVERLIPDEPHSFPAWIRDEPPALLIAAPGFLPRIVTLRAILANNASISLDRAYEFQVIAVDESGIVIPDLKISLDPDSTGCFSYPLWPRTLEEVELPEQLRLRIRGTSVLQAYKPVEVSMEAYGYEPTECLHDPRRGDLIRTLVRKRE